MPSNYLYEEFFIRMETMDRMVGKMINHLANETSVLSNMPPILYEDLSGKIIGLSYEVMNELGVGFLESVYHKSLEIALRASNLRVQSEVPLRVTFRGFESVTTPQSL